MLVVAETTAETTLEGEEKVDQRREQIEAVPGGGTYSVATNVSGERAKQTRTPVEVPVETDPLSAYGSLVAALLGLAGAGGLLWARREGKLDLSPSTRTGIRLQGERNSFDEWISTGRVPPVGDDERIVVVDSLTDLVDVAIDSERRVIEDADSATYVVFDDGTTDDATTQKCALLAEERQPREFYGFWSYDPSTVDYIVDHLETRYGMLEQ